MSEGGRAIRNQKEMHSFKIDTILSRSLFGRSCGGGSGAVEAPFKFPHTCFPLHEKETMQRFSQCHMALGKCCVAKFLVLVERYPPYFCRLCFNFKSHS